MNSIARRRLASQHLVVPALRSAVDVVRRLGAVQAQDYPSAKWAIGQRTKSLVDADIEDAFTRGAILRTHVLRPTWHFVLPEDARWMLELTAPRVKVAATSYDLKLGLDENTFHKSNRVLERALRDGNQLTRTELREVLQRAGIKVPTGHHAGNLLFRAEQDRVVISGARRGKQFTYALFDERVPPAPRRDPDEALGELAARYFATRSPATLLDFVWWSGLRVAAAKRAIEIARLRTETHNGRAYWATRDAAASRPRASIAHLLPNYDEYFIGFKDRSAFAERLGGAVTGARFDGLIGHGLFVDGQFVGGWDRPAGKQQMINLRLLLKLTRAERELVDRAARRFGEYLGAPVMLR